MYVPEIYWFQLNINFDLVLYSSSLGVSSSERAALMFTSGAPLGMSIGEFVYSRVADQEPDNLNLTSLLVFSQGFG